MVLLGSWTYLFKGKQLECSLTHETRSYVPIFRARGPTFYQQWARLSPCRRHISMANWSFTAPSHLPCQWWAMWGAATIFPRHWHAEITSVWNGTTFSRLSSQWHRQSTSFRHVCHFPPSKLGLQDWICFIGQSCGTKQNRSKYQKHQTTEDTDLKPFSLSNLDFMKLYHLHKNVRIKVTRIQFSVGTTASNSVTPSFFAANSRTLRHRVSALRNRGQ